MVVAVANNVASGKVFPADELQTFVGQKKNKIWIWTVVDHWKPGIILWTVGDRSSLSFEILWLTIKCWQSFWSSVLRRLMAEPTATAKRYVTNGWKVYPNFIKPEAHLVCKTYMTRVEGENTRLRHYLASRVLSRRSTAGEDAARLHRKTLCYSKSLQMLKLSIRLLLHCLKFQSIVASLIL
jgi:insertion element IS1 protein InsB